MVKKRVAKILSLEQRLGKNLATRRKSLGLTQEYVAQHLDVEPETISRFERGVTTPSLKTIENLASLLSVTIAELLDEQTPGQPESSIVIAGMLKLLNAADQAYVIESARSLCHYLTAIRKRKS